MLSAKIALGALAVIGGSAASFTGILATAVPALSEGTPVTITVGLIVTGFGFAATSAWKISRAWSAMEARQAEMQKSLDFLMKEYDRKRLEEEHDLRRRH